MADPDDRFVNTLKMWVEVFTRRSGRDFVLYARSQGLSMSQVNSLFHIHKKGGGGISDVGDELGVTSAAASQMVERLVQQGLLSRSEDQRDRRLKLIALTERGHQILHEAILTRQRWLENLAQQLSPAEKEQVMAGLQILIDKAVQLEGPLEQFDESGQGCPPQKK